jgi:hypothetical protein
MNQNHKSISRNSRQIKNQIKNKEIFDLIRKSKSKLNQIYFFAGDNKNENVETYLVGF